MIQLLDDIDLTQTLEKKEYNERLAKLQLKVRKLQLHLKDMPRSLVIVMEGWDAAGKGGTIRRVTSVLDPRAYKVTPVAAPTPEELSHHYLWRFAIRMPEPGKMQIFDRSWYGRVLVERVEGFASNEEWGRAYQEINTFERQLTDNGAVVCKFFLHISPEEQLQRFEARKNDPLKSWKLTEEDWRNREKWSVYQDAINDMFEKTSQPHAPWLIVPANCKRFARVFLLEKLIGHVESALGIEVD